MHYKIVGHWIPGELNFDVLNYETTRDNKIFFTIAVDLVVDSIEEPVRFVIEAKAKISPFYSTTISATEKFWQNLSGYKGSKHLSEQFHMILRPKQDESQSTNDKPIYQVISCFSSTQLVQHKLRYSAQLNIASKDNKADGDTNGENDDNDEEPLQSGTGFVSKECSESVLKEWKSVLEKWHSDLNTRPKEIKHLVHNGIPEALRAEVWQLLSGSFKDEDKLIQQYKTLVNSESSFEAVIQRDIYRTFPAHERFRDNGSPGELFKNSGYMRCSNSLFQIKNHCLKFAKLTPIMIKRLATVKDCHFWLRHCCYICQRSKHFVCSCT